VSNPVQYQQSSEKKYLRDPVLDLPNTCSIGFVQAIWEGDKITETYCRCPDGSYGYTCTENFINPCASGQQYHPADRRLPKNYFVTCSWTTPYLLKCPTGTVWNQEIYLCDWNATSTYGYPSSMSQSYNQPNIKITPASNYNVQIVKPIQAPPVYTQPNYSQMPNQVPIPTKDGARLSLLAYSSNNQHNLNHLKENRALAVKTLSNKQPVSQQVNQAANNKYISQPKLSNQMAVNQQINAIKTPMHLSSIPNSMQHQQQAIRSLLKAQQNNPLYNNLLYNRVF